MCYRLEWVAHRVVVRSLGEVSNAKITLNLVVLRRADRLHCRTGVRRRLGGSKDAHRCAVFLDRLYAGINVGYAWGDPEINSGVALAVTGTTGGLPIAAASAASSGRS